MLLCSCVAPLAYVVGVGAVLDNEPWAVMWLTVAQYGRSPASLRAPQQIFTELLYECQGGWHASAK